jgi:hypothetical protein
MLMGGFQVALVIALRVAKEKHIQWPLNLMAALSAALLAAGVLRHYWDIYVHRTVRGISFIFVGIDAMGDLTSLISVLFQSKLDVLGLVIYGTELVLWIGVFAFGGYYNFVPWVLKRISKRNSGSPAIETVYPVPSRASVHERADLGAGEAVSLHDLPSSTSVFRTPSGELDMVRARTVASRGCDSVDGAFP